MLTYILIAASVGAAVYTFKTVFDKLNAAQTRLMVLEEKTKNIILE